MSLPRNSQLLGALMLPLVRVLLAFVGFTFGGSGGGGGLLDDDEAGSSSFLSGDLGFIEISTFFNSWMSPFNWSICCCA